MQIFRYAETGSIKFLWIIGTNPAVSLPELHRIREILAQERLFVVVQDAFLTETAELADVVLPAAIWGEKTGTFTNADRTVHISHKAVEPPGEARSDLDIFLDFARRMDFRDKDGSPLIKWSTPEGAFEAWKECTRGRPCDYTRPELREAPRRLAASSGRATSGTPTAPSGSTPTASSRRVADECEDFGHDLVTGAAITPTSYRAHDPAGKAFLKAADYEPPHEEPRRRLPVLADHRPGRLPLPHPDQDGPRAGAAAAAPEVWVQLAPGTRRRWGSQEGDMVEVESPRGSIEARRGSATCARATSSCRSTTATGTRTTWTTAEPGRRTS